ncbi:MAG TPA: UDP-2,3-diacylglucosamine diphosphatase LpxI [Alphaproteobacteria bacterium]
MTGKLGILAGGGQLPVRVIEACRSTGRDFFVLAFEGQTDPDTVAGTPHRWVRLGAVGEAFRHLHAAGVSEVVMAGPVRRPSLEELRPDWRGAMFLAKVGARAFGDDGLLSAIVRELEAEGFRVIGADDVFESLRTPLGLIGRLAPTDEARVDIARGIEVLRAIGALDIGQAVVVQQGVVLGVEAIEGTDALLERCGRVRREGRGGVLVKISKPGQERRVDLPTIGPDTVAGAVSAGLCGIALEAGRTLIIDRPAVARAADEAGLFVVGVKGE